jgi:hypothetical protein
MRKETVYSKHEIGHRTLHTYVVAFITVELVDWGGCVQPMMWYVQVYGAYCTPTQ